MAVDYGSDISCTQDVDPAMPMVSGNLVVAQALLRRIITPRGMLIDDPSYGTDITQFINDDLGPADIARIAAGVDAEFQKDARVISSQTTPTFSGGVFTLVSKVNGANGPFTLVAQVSAVSAKILSVSP